MTDEKKCFICERPMADEECGDELPEERICDECSNRVELDVYEPRSGDWLATYIDGEPILVDDYDGEDMWFEVDILINGEVSSWAQYNENLLRWEIGGP